MGTLLFLILCLCGYLAGHKLGYQDGKALWDIMPLYFVSYVATDLTDSDSDSDSDLDELVGEITQEVVPDCWVAAGGNCQVKPNSKNNSLVVKANAYVHDELARYHKALHDERIASIAPVGERGLE